MVKQIVFLIGVSFAILCSQVDIGTDVSTIGNVISGGAVQAGWNYHDASYKSSPAQSEIYFYVKGFNLLGPKFEVQEFHHEDEKAEDDHRWLFMNVSIDEKVNGLFKDYRAYKVIQQCVDREGGTTLRVNVTFKAFSCDPITFNWIKVCGEPTATRESLYIGLKETTSEVVKNGVVTSLFDGNIKQKVYTVQTEVESLTFYAYLGQGFLKAFYNEPYIITDHEVMYPTASGSFAKTGWLESEVLDFTINFNCLVDDGIKEEVILVVELPYYHDLEIHFFKICGEVTTSTSYFTYFLYSALILGSLGLIILGYFYSKNNSSPLESISESFQFLLNFCREKSSNLLNRAPQRFSNESDDDGKQGFNVHTTYGTT